MNQTAAQIKLQEAWKVDINKSYPINLMSRKITEDGGEQHRSVKRGTPLKCRNRPQKRSRMLNPTAQQK